jgi:probable rRNA maturation factor
MDVLVTVHSEAPRGVTAAKIKRAAAAMLRALELPRAELSIVLCDDREIHALNRTYRRKDKPTDVLAFAMREGEGGERAGDVLGDVVISTQTAARQAVEHEHTVTTEILTLLAHGLLHLLGWDHRTDAEDLRMRTEVARLVERAKAGDRTRPTRARRR